MKLILNDPILGKRTIESNDRGDFAIGVVFDQYALLKSLEAKKAEDDNPELLWEIRLYEFILKAPDAKDRALKYLDTRCEKGTRRPRPKREVASILGWIVE